MVVAGFAVGARDLPRLSELGVKDSKQLSAARREAMAPLLEAMAGGIHRVELSPAELDRGNLTDLELEAFARCILELKPAAVYADAPVGPKAIPRFRARLLERLAPFSPELTLENRADVRFPVVSAASILAKVRRDRRIAELKEVHGEIGSGYPGDPVTRRFLIAWMERHGSPPPMARTRWATFDRLSQRRFAF